MADFYHLRAVRRLALTAAIGCCGLLAAAVTVGAATEVPNVLRRPLSEARRTLASSGFAVRLEGGDPAPAPELAFAVQMQHPPAGTVVPAGAVVTLRVYSAGVARVVPDVVGLSPEAARQLLAARGLRVLLEGGDPAPSPELAFRVQSQDPGAASVPAGDRPVTVRIHSNYDPSFASPALPPPEATTPYVFDVLAAGATDAALSDLLGDAVAAFTDHSGSLVKTFKAPQLGIAETTVWYDDVGRARWLRIRLLRSLPPRVAALLFDLAGNPETIGGNPLSGWRHGVSLGYPDQGVLIHGRDDSTVEIWRIDPTLEWSDVAAVTATAAGG